MLTSRSGTQGNASAAPPPSIEVVRRRARHRLIGAAVLVLAGVVGFSLLFDTQPRPLPVDIPIVIPAKNTAPALPAPKATAAKEAPTAEAPVAAADSLGPREEVLPSATKAEAKPADTKPADTKPAAEAKAPAKPETKPDTKPATRPEPAKPAEADRARALLEGKATDKTDAPKADAAAERIVVQVGAFADVARAREARQKLERAGLKTYTHVADTADGKRIRVRVGPFATKADADKAAARVKALGLPAAILTL